MVVVYKLFRVRLVIYILESLSLDRVSGEIHNWGSYC